MLKDFGHGIGKAYSEMSYREKAVYGLALFALAGVVADNVANEGKYTKSAKDKAVKSLKSMEDVYKSIAKKTPAVVIAADSLAPTPAPTVMPANGSAETIYKAPERYQLNYNGILIKGDKQFIKDVVISLEFGKEYYPEGELKYTKEIEATNATPEMAAGQGYTSVNASVLHKGIETGGIVTNLVDFGHEDWHNYASLNDPKNNTEKLAGENGIKVWNKLINMNESEKKKFVEEFDFSKYEKEIQTI